MITVRNCFAWNFCKLYNCNISLQKLGYFTPPRWVTPPSAFTWENTYKTSPHLGRLPAPAERVTHLGGAPHLSCKRDHDEKRLYMNRWVTPLHRVTSPTWDTSPSCKLALTLTYSFHLSHLQSAYVRFSIVSGSVTKVQVNTTGEPASRLVFYTVKWTTTRCAIYILMTLNNKILCEHEVDLRLGQDFPRLLLSSFHLSAPHFQPRKNR